MASLNINYIGSTLSFLRKITIDPVVKNRGSKYEFEAEPSYSRAFLNIFRDR